MHHTEKTIPAIINYHTRRKGFFFVSVYTIAVFFTFLFLPWSVIAEKIENGQSLDQQLLAYEIAGISLTTPLEKIPAVLASHGYTQTGSMTYTKQVQVPGQRKAVYRIEIDDTPNQRQIIYFRGQSGGRVKSSALQEKPLPGDEMEMAQKLYQMICAGIPPQIQQARACQPATNSMIIFGQGEFIEIEKNISAQLNASADSTTIGIKYFKE